MENTLWGPIKIRATAELLLLPPLSTYTAHNQKGCMYECCCCSIVSFECTRHWLTWKEMKQKTKLVSIQFLLRSQRCNRQHRTAPYTHTCTFMHQRVSTRMYTCLYMCVCTLCISARAQIELKINPKKKKEKETRRFLNVFFEKICEQMFSCFSFYAMFLG